MKKKNVCFFAILIFLFSTKVVSAACDVTETNRLNGLAVSVRSDYEEIYEVLDPNDYDLPDGTNDNEVSELKKVLFKVNIYNVTEDLYVVVHNSVTNETKKYTYGDSKDGIISFTWSDIYSIVNYTITVYSSSKTGCPDTKLHTLYQTTPKYNEYSSLAACEGAEKFYLCYKYIAVETTDFSDFISKVEEYKKGQINEKGEEINPENKKNESFIRKHKTGIMITIVGILIAGGGTVVVVANRRNGKSEK